MIAKDREEPGHSRAKVIKLTAITAIVVLAVGGVVLLLTKLHKPNPEFKYAYFHGYPHCPDPYEFLNDVKPGDPKGTLEPYQFFVVEFQDLLKKKGAELTLVNCNLPTQSTLRLDAVMGAIDSLDAAERKKSPNFKWRLIGNSLGGYIVALWASRNPDKVDRTFMIGPPFNMEARWADLLHEMETGKGLPQGSLLQKWKQEGVLDIGWDKITCGCRLGRDYVKKDKPVPKEQECELGECEGTGKVHQPFLIHYAAYDDFVKFEQYPKPQNKAMIVGVVEDTSSPLVSIHKYRDMAPDLVKVFDVGPGYGHNLKDKKNPDGPRTQAAMKVVSQKFVEHFEL